MLQPEVKETCAAWVKHATRIPHEEAEAVMMPLIKAADTPVRYTTLLQGVYGFYRPMEAMLDPFAAIMPLPDGPFRRTHLLEKDIGILGHTPTAQCCTHLPEINNNLQAVGALYVLEGAALGGRIIARMLGQHVGLPAPAFHFFKGREEATGAYWTRFTQFMNRQAQTRFQLQQVSEAAHATFAAYTHWMKTL